MLTRRAFAVAALPLLSACQNGAQQRPLGGAAAWREAPPAPYPVQEIYPALHNSEIWIAGGFAPLAAFGATARVIVFDPAQQRWRDGPALPDPAHHVHLASLSGELWAIGGFLAGDNRRRWICTTRVLKLAGDAWMEGPALPKPIGEAAPITHAGRIHLIGGRSALGRANLEWDDQADVDDHFVIAPGERAWRRAAPLPMARNSAAGVSDGERLHVISGRTVAHGQTAAHHVYDPRTDAWSIGPAYPDPRGGLAGAFWRGRVVAGGGEIFEPGSVGDALYEFVGGAWRRFETMPTPRHGHGLIAAGDSLYALGGARRPSARDTLSSVDALG
jgi:N-acetylneuraminic acid mutarotase